MAEKKKTKRCNKCGEEKDLISEFCKYKKSKDGRNTECKECVRKRNKKFYSDNREAEKRRRKEYVNNNREKVKAYNRDYYCENIDRIKSSRKAYRENNLEYVRERDRKYRTPEKSREYSREYRQRHPDRVKQTYKKWLSENPEYHKKYVKNRRKTNVQFRIACILRSRLRDALKGGCKTGSAIGLLGCSIGELKKYLETKFYINPETKEEMHWGNQGYRGWHIDHIKPLSSFDLTDKRQLDIACHYTNLQPLWAKENMKKGNSIYEKNN